MNRDEQHHIKIRDHVLAEARRLAREAYPIASENVIKRLAASGLQAAVLQCDPLGETRG